MDKVYTDGSCLGNPGPGGWAAISNDFKIGGGTLHTTNNAMELMAAVNGIEACSNNIIEIYTDSVYVKNGIEKWIHNWIKNGWKTSNGSPVKNKDLWKKLYDITQTKTVGWNWVKAHSTNEMNNKVDKLAREIATLFKQNLS